MRVGGCITNVRSHSGRTSRPLWVLLRYSPGHRCTGCPLSYNGMSRIEWFVGTIRYFLTGVFHFLRGTDKSSQIALTRSDYCCTAFFSKRIYEHIDTNIDKPTPYGYGCASSSLLGFRYLPSTSLVRHSTGTLQVEELPRRVSIWPGCCLASPHGIANWPGSWLGS